MPFPTKPLTNTFLLRTGEQGLREVLLGEKKRGWMTGSWNGFGGKVDEGETMEEAAARELQEESGVEGKDIKRVGLFFQTFEDRPEARLEVHIFTCEEWSGEVQETEEMRPQWWPVDAVPTEKMWADDRYWFPFMLDKKCFKGNCHFSTDKPDAMLSHHFEEISREELNQYVAKEGYHPNK